VNPTKAIRVLVVDDHEALRNSVRQILSLYADILPDGEASDGITAIASCAERHPDVILMDMIMPVMDGIEAAHRIRNEYPEVGIILWAFSSSPELAEKARASGANRILTKILPPDDLVNHIREVSHLKNGYAV
jgi:two-component system, NarL family, response regulator LiaR